ncbi:MULTISPECIES: acyl-CoA dehydrogenase family protein [unclassified Mycolicibacterium]|uniref:acyl-CoA dehydrogenase family protein n=1 Tax=unclassified Mycolicibacterium TaxID=2636767 RepID=UPI0012DD7DCC|nr:MULTISPECIES: acyl-CoA dehydrogenase family protein [unclassified Mycolicibacterium]MUL80952.1 acyl-CoA dehydrogenase [Mycolicibacterium sp. CBMA 329]MUL86718.1 acyl-CoA dehydrogenase [Mycolicibacterium sp. CBMA 331]MUL98996.1 acyl-CoA dehydrogenase [Mycolicibacterium sp. CBMA 334]MUM28177.1 acyl-CoA dehydrogenase [Mycolicibacterium sp. CBMA 295]MUM37015.1 acyl-CoA dehydrogenase [Mycolicibacterium sp. CBMA 247]
MSVVDPELVEMMSAVFAAHRERHQPGEAIAELWGRLSELGLVRLTGSEESGGSGAGWAEAVELLRAAAWHGVRIPLAEHDLLACWLLEAAGLVADDSRRTACLLDDGAARGVPWAADADRVVLVWRDGAGYQVADVDTASLSVGAGYNSAGEPRDDVSVDIANLTGTPVSDNVIEQFTRRAALVRAVQVCAALDRTLELTVAHAGERIQFGRPLAKFQAVQNLVADIAAESALARAATDGALAEALRSDWSSPNLDFLVAVARSCVGHAASVVVRNAHQVHGAIGTTREHRLHEFTMPALAWRSEYGSVAHWDGVLTDFATAAGADGLWALITATGD